MNKNELNDIELYFEQIQFFNNYVTKQNNKIVTLFNNNDNNQFYYLQMFDNDTNKKIFYYKNLCNDVNDMYDYFLTLFENARYKFFNTMLNDVIKIENYIIFNDINLNFELYCLNCDYKFDNTNDFIIKLKNMLHTYLHTKNDDYYDFFVENYICLSKIVTKIYNVTILLKIV